MDRREKLEALPPQLLAHYEKAGTFPDITQVQYFPEHNHHIEVHRDQVVDHWRLVRQDPVRWVRKNT